MNNTCIVTWVGWPIPFVVFFPIWDINREYSSTQRPLLLFSHLATLWHLGLCQWKAALISGSDSYNHCIDGNRLFSPSRHLFVCNIKKRHLINTKSVSLLSAASLFTNTGRAQHSCSNGKVQSVWIQTVFQSKINRPTSALSLNTDVWFWLNITQIAGASKARRSCTVNERLKYPQ